MSGRLIVEHPPGYAPERAYIHDVLLREFLGLEYQTVCADRRDIRITLNGDSGERQLTLADVLFQTPENDWLTQSSMPVSPGKDWWDAVEVFPDTRLLQKPVPVIYGQPGESNCVSADCINLNLDIFGSAFFMLTRYEEVVVRQRDEHERFSAQASFAGMAGVLDRPIVNEYLEILWHALSSLWPGLERRQRQYSVALSHDVDWPLCTAGRPAYRAARTVAADLVNRKAPGTALRRAKGHVQAMRGCPDADLCNTFDFIMDHSERRGLISAFNFIASRSAGDIDGCYSLDDHWIRGLIARVSRRGHEIGLHPSYNSFQDAALTRHEYEKLRVVTDDLGIEQERWGGRQHYLRWECPTTWQNWEDAGLDYDSTLSFSDAAGFRCGVCYDYPVFNLETRERLKLREHPLIAMEVTLTGYMGLSWDGARQTILRLSNECRTYDGEFTLLWHNNFLVSNVERRTYAAVLEAVKG